MNKTELIAAMAEASGLTKKDCDTALNAFVDTLQTALKSFLVRPLASAIAVISSVLFIVFRLLHI